MEAPAAGVVHVTASRRAILDLIDARSTLASVVWDGRVVLKGADYMFRLYPRPELRPMRDLDILIPRRRCEALCARLRAAGLTPHVARSPPRCQCHTIRLPHTISRSTRRAPSRRGHSPRTRRRTGATSPRWCTAMRWGSSDDGNWP